MLILTRKVGESVLIGDDISITVLSVRGNQVKLGVHLKASSSWLMPWPGKYQARAQ